jgi:NodT family efflux transporter outer membrane factor (OMF) lipoprotein
MPHAARPLPLLASTAAALALSACAAVGPNFKSPPPPTGAAGAGYAMAGDKPPEGAALAPEARAAGPWWQAFGSPALDQAVRESLRDSPTVAEAVATLQRARAEAQAVAGDQAVQVDGMAGYQRERINVQAFGFSGFPSPTINLFQVGTTVSYDLDLFGGRKRATEQARADAEAEAQRADAAYLALSGNVAMQAMRIAGLRAQIAAVQAVVADDAQVVDIVRNAARAGGQPPSAVPSAVAQYAEDRALIPPLQRELDAARHQMALLAGKSPAEWSAPDFDLDGFTIPSAVPVSLPSALVRKRPDILAAEAELHSATAAIGVAVAAQYPDVKLTGGWTQAAIHPKDFFNYSSAGWNIGPQVNLPIFHGGTLSAERRAAEAEARAAMARYQQTVLRAFVQVSDVLAALGADQDSITALTEAADAAGKNAHNAQTAFNLGGGTLMDVIDAQRTLSRTRRNLIEAQARQLADFVQLYTATASDWRTAG